MIALDTSSVVAYLQGASGNDVEAVDAALEDRLAVLPPVVVSELLSDPKPSRDLAALIEGLPRLPLDDGYWARVGGLRRLLLARGLKARLGDALVAQSCLDHQVALVTRDADFRHYSRLAGLRLA